LLWFECMTTPFTEELPRNLTYLANRLTDDLPSAEVYLVGGAVRDIILKRDTKDFDLVARGVEPERLEAWLADHGQVNLVGKTFGVFKWQPAGWAGEAIDVALPRTEHSDTGTGEYRDFSVQSDPKLPIIKDLERRDFTINAMAVNLASGELQDPVGGRADITAKLMRAVGEPHERFRDDLSRVLRCLRQACELSFTIERTTWNGVLELSQRASTGTRDDGRWLVPREVIARELIKSLAASPRRAIELWDQAGLINLLLPEVSSLKHVPQPKEFHTEGDVFTHTLLALEALSSPAWQNKFAAGPPSPNVNLATLLHDIGKAVTLRTPEQDGVERIRTDGHDTAGAAFVLDICERLALPSYLDPHGRHVEAEAVRWLVEHHLLLVHGLPESLRTSTVYRYFLADETRGTELLQVILADSLASIPPSGQSSTNLIDRMFQRIAAIKASLPQGTLKPLLSGTDIMERFSLSPGPKVGELIELLTEAQLNGTVRTVNEAETYLQERL
jgi:tRNA nucleotidyltransferase/poly(A) polymerase